MEIFVASGDIEKAITRLKRDFQKNINRDLLKHSFFESRGVRKRRKRLKAIQRLKKLESRSISRTDEAIRREAHDKRPARMGLVRA